MHRSDQDLADDIAYFWRTDAQFRAWWRAYMRANNLAHADYALTGPELTAARARTRAAAQARTKKILQQRRTERAS